MHEIKTRAAVREEGAGACRAGRPETDNPYWPGSVAHLEWHAGFKDEQYGAPKPQKELA